MVCALNPAVREGSMGSNEQLYLAEEGVYLDEDDTSSHEDTYTLDAGSSRSKELCMISQEKVFTDARHSLRHCRNTTLGNLDVQEKVVQPQKSKQKQV